MSTGATIFRRVVSIHKYPKYIAHLYINKVLTSFWRRRGLEIGKGTRWLGMPIISMTTGSKILIGDNCLICSRSDQTALGVNHPVVLRTLSHRAELRIGSNVRMSGTTICAMEKILVGDRCVIGANVTIADTDFHSLDPLLRSSPEDALNAHTRPVLIGDDVFIGGGSVIMKGVCIGRGAVVGAGSVVTKDVSPMMIVAGNPAVPIRKID